MKSKLFEQIVDWEEFDNLPDVTKSDSVVVNPKIIKKSKIIKKDNSASNNKIIKKPKIIKKDNSASDDKKIHNDDPQTTLGRHLAELHEFIQELIINAIYFNREIASKVKAFNIDEMAVYRICTKRLKSSVHACYVDVILRLIYPNATMQKFIAKNKAAYEYFFSRNYSTITLKSQKFQEIDPENSSNGFIIRGINQIFNSNTRPGNWFDWDSAFGIKQLNDLRASGVFKTASSKTNKFILNMKFTDSQIHERVMTIYREMIFGKPRNYIGKSAEYDRNRNKTN